MAALLSAVLLAVFAVGLVNWGRAVHKLVSRQAIVAWEPRRQVPWSLLDLIAVMVLSIVATGLIQQLLEHFGWKLAESDAADSPDASKAYALALSLSSLAAMALAVVLVAPRAGATLSDFGWSSKRFAHDVQLGLGAFTMLAPPVLVLQAILVQFWESKHPLMEMYRGAPDDAALFAFLAIAAVLVAPLVEEFLFRVLLQGYLERLFAGEDSLRDLLVGGRQHVADAETVVPNHSPDVAEVQAAGEAAGPEIPFPQEQPAGVAATSGVRRPPAPWAPLARWAPVLISSLIFALLHWQHGPDWLPLTLLALGMGYLYQRTHRITPSLVIHMSLNGLSMWNLWIVVHQPAK